MQVVDERSTYAVGAFGTFLSTSDGGKKWTKCKFSWEKQTPLLVERVSPSIEPHFNGLYFVSKNIGWVVGEFGLVLHTKDGGQTWTTQRSGPDLPQLCAVIFFDEQKGWAIGQEGTLICTKDGGKNWLPSNIGTNKDLYAAALEHEHMVIVGNYIVLKTENGGSTWTRKELVENGLLNGVALTSKVAIAVGQNGTIRQIE